MKEEKIFNLIKEKITKMELSSEEKSLMRSNISEKLIENIPVRFVEDVPSPYVADTMSTRSIIKFNTKNNMLIGAIIAAILSGSVSFAAQSSLPGDTLYPVKIHVNESVGDLVAVSSVSQAKWDTAKIERRLNEAKTLEKEGKLDAVKKEILKSEVALHIQSLKTELSNIEKSGNKEDITSIKNNLGSLISEERLSLPAGERGVGQMINNSTSTVNASGTVIVSNITASSTKGRGDDGDNEGEFDDFVKSLKDTVGNVNDESENNNHQERNNEATSTGNIYNKEINGENSSDVKNKFESAKDQNERSGKKVEGGDSND